MSFKDLDEIFKIQPIRLPIKGKTYEFPGSVSGRTGLLLHRMTEAVASMRDGSDPEVDAQTEILDDAEEVNLRTEILGGAEKQLIEDGIPNEFISHVMKTLIAWHQFGKEVAEKVWEDVPGAPKAPTDRKPKAKPRKATSASASTTKRPASTKSTSESTKAPRGDDSSSTGD